jgi:uroporphyrinogen-III decarboxylase
LGLLSDFRTPRYIEYPLKDEGDLGALDYIFPVETNDYEGFKAYYNERRKLADEFNVPLFVYYDAGMDWLMWLFPPEEQIYQVADNPDFIKKLLGRINAAKMKRLEMLLDLGADGIYRRGWYEGADLWNPEIIREFAHPVLEKEIKMTQDAGKVFIYTLDTGAKAIAADLKKLNPDAIIGLDPVQGDMTVRDVKEVLPDITLWGGFSGPGHFGADSPKVAAEAVREAIGVYGRKRLVLGMACSYRYYYPWENYQAAEDMWKKLR